MSSKQTIPPRKKPRFTLIVVVSLLIVFGVAVAILEYGNLTNVNMDISASPHAYFVVANGSNNVTTSEGENAVVQVPQHTTITVYVFPDPSYQVAGWSVSPVSVTTTGLNSVQIVTGSDGSTIKVSVTLTNATASG
ncbi:MAG: hypothetical protein OK456_08790 [Thaumarchaeota archaeon]|nr:hypothetical protein [Nitrososphaerota archaeon]